MQASQLHQEVLKSWGLSRNPQKAPSSEAVANRGAGPSPSRLRQQLGCSLRWVQDHPVTTQDRWNGGQQSLVPPQSSGTGQWPQLPQGLAAGSPPKSPFLCSRWCLAPSIFLQLWLVSPTGAGCNSAFFSSFIIAALFSSPKHGPEWGG